MLGSGDHQEIVAPPLIAGLQPHRLGTRLRSRPSRLSVWLRLSLVEGDAGAVLEAERLLESVDGAIDVVSISLLAPEAEAARGGDIRGTWRRLLSVCREHRVSTVLVDYPRSNPLSAIQPALDAGAGGLVIRSAAEHLQTGDIRTAVQQARRAVASPGLVVVADGARSPRDVVEPSPPAPTSSPSIKDSSKPAPAWRNAATRRSSRCEPGPLRATGRQGRNRRFRPPCVQAGSGSSYSARAC